MNVNPPANLPSAGGPAGTAASPLTSPPGGHPTLLILAAGLGSRYGGLKQMETVGPRGETLLDYSVFDAIRAGFGKLVFVIRKAIEQPFRQGVGERFERHLPVEYVFQELDRLPPGWLVPPGRTKPWGTTHAILMAAEVIQGPFVAINADDFYGAEAYRLLAQHFASGSPDQAMVAFVLRNTLSEFGAVARGLCRVGPDGLLRSVTELTGIERDGAGVKDSSGAAGGVRLTGDELVSMNMWGFTPAWFPRLEESFRQFLAAKGADLKSECYIPTTVSECIAAGRARVRVLRTAGAWCGVTYREDQPRVAAHLRDLIARGEYPDPLWP